MGLREWFSAREAIAWLQACDRVGPGARLRGRPFIKNSGRIEIGARFQLSSSPVQSHLVTWKGGLLDIGDDVAIAHGAAIACQARVCIGADTQIGPFLVLADSDFHVVGNRAATPAPRSIEIGRGVHIGARVNILPGTVIGDSAIVEPGSTVAGAIAAGALVAGVPARSAHPGRGEAPAGELDDSIRRLVANVLGLRESPALTDGPREIEEWDSLGSLRILLAVEDACAIRLEESDMARLSSIAELVGMVERKRAAK